MWKKILTRFGTPRILISNNDTQFKSSPLKNDTRKNESTVVSPQSHTPKPTARPRYQTRPLLMGSRSAWWNQKEPGLRSYRWYSGGTVPPRGLVRGKRLSIWCMARRWCSYSKSWSTHCKWWISMQTPTRWNDVRIWTYSMKNPKPPNSAKWPTKLAPKKL